MKLNLRDLFWLILVVAIALGWWLDRDRIRQQTVAIQAAAKRLDALPARSAEIRLQVAELEFAQMQIIKLKSTGTLTENELRLAKLRLDAARTDLERAQAKETYGE